MHCQYCGSGVSRALFAKPVGLLLMVIIAMVSLAAGIAWHSPVALSGLALSLVAGKAYWPSSAPEELSQAWLLLSVAVLGFAWLGGVI